MNVRDTVSVRNGISAILTQFHRLDFLVSNAGGQFASPADSISDNGWRSVVDLNLNGTWNVVSQVYRAWMKEHGGSIVCVTADFHNGYVCFPLFRFIFS